MLAQAIAAGAALERNVLSVRRNEVRNTKHRKDRVKGGRRKLLLARHSRTQSSDDDDAVLAVRRTDLGSEFSLGCIACSLFRPLLPFSSSLDAASFSGRIGCSLRSLSVFVPCHYNKLAGFNNFLYSILTAV